MITVVDNYDSFTFNLVQQIERLAGERPEVVRNDRFDPEELIASAPRAIVISPGPGTPSRAGRCIDLIRRNRTIPLLGVCLGHQAIGEAFGAAVVRGGAPVHGKVSEVRHRGERLFAGCPQPMRTARYHSLVVDRATIPSVLEVDAETDDGAVMALSHRELPVFGIQFHPESFGTVDGDRLIVNFLNAIHPDGAGPGRSRGSHPPARRARAAPHPAFGHPLPAGGERELAMKGPADDRESVPSTRPGALGERALPLPGPAANDGGSR